MLAQALEQDAEGSHLGLKEKVEKAYWECFVAFRPQSLPSDILPLVKAYFLSLSK